MNWATGGLANRKTREGGTHPDRDAQFEHLNAQVEVYLSAGEPVISGDAKKKELVGDAQKSWTRMVPARPAGRGAGVGLPHCRSWASDPVWRLRPGAEYRLGQCRHRP
jgi:Rhodopirellula transposase DDE domain